MQVSALQKKLHHKMTFHFTNTITGKIQVFLPKENQRLFKLFNIFFIRDNTDVVLAKLWLLENQSKIKIRSQEQLASILEYK